MSQKQFKLQQAVNKLRHQSKDFESQALQIWALFISNTPLNVVIGKYSFVTI